MSFNNSHDIFNSIYQLIVSSKTQQRRSQMQLVQEYFVTFFFLQYLFLNLCPILINLSILIHILSPSYRCLGHVRGATRHVTCYLTCYKTFGTCPLVLLTWEVMYAKCNKVKKKR
jgi:hypothetical protein